MEKIKFVRAFVCVSPPPEEAEKLAEFIAGARRAAPLLYHCCKWVSRGQIHLTLRFLGESDPELLQKLDSNLSSMGGVRAFDVELEGVGAFPNMARPNIFWLGAVKGAPELAKLASRVEGIARNSYFPPENKKFKPHMTLARAKNGAAIPAAILSELPELLKDAPKISWRCDELILMKSVLTPEGPIHTPLNKYKI